MTRTPHQNWRERAACLGMDTTLFFPTQGESTTEAKAICASCSVRSECGSYALTSGQRFGVWGGQTERDRRRQRSVIRRTAGPEEVPAA